MKKIVFCLFVFSLLAFSSAKAQIFVGGNFDIGHKEVYKENSLDYGISAKIGYVFKPHFRFGLSAGYNAVSEKKYLKGIKSSSKEKSSKYNIFPFVQYRVYNYEKFNVFAEASVGYYNEKSVASVANVSTTLRNDNGFGVIFRPVIVYTVNTHFRLTAALNILSLNFDYAMGQKTNGSEDYYSFRFGGGSRIGNLGIGYVF